jgi:predicted ferric reductase
MLIPLATAAGNHEYWLISRATGTAAMIFASVAVCIAYLYGFVAEDRERAIKLGAWHELLGLATIIAMAVHGFVLLGDNFFNANIADIVVPFAQSYRRGGIAVGVIGGYIMTVLALLYYVRHKIGPARFKLIHRFTVLGWLLAAIHTGNAGTDQSNAWYLAVVVPFLVAVPATFLLRLVRRRQIGLEPSPARR